MYPSLRVTASIASFLLVLLLLWLVMPSADDPEDVVRSYLGHLRMQQIMDNYGLLSGNVKQQLRAEHIHDRHDYFDFRLGEFPSIHKYSFLSSERAGDIATIVAEVRLSQLDLARTGAVVGIDRPSGPAIDTLTFTLIKESDGWMIDMLDIDGVAFLP
jgi:hypothetical protein